MSRTLKIQVNTDAERDKYVLEMAQAGYHLVSSQHEAGSGSMLLVFEQKDEVLEGEVLRPLGVSKAQGPSVSAKFKPLICTPCYGGLLTQQYVQGYASLIHSLEKSGCQYVPLIFGGESLITRARNRAVAEFIRSDCTHLLFIDADIGFKAEDVGKLYQMNEEVVCGAYPLKSYDWTGVSNAAKQGEPAERLEEAGTCYAANMFPAATSTGRLDVIKRAGYHYVEIQDAATGFLLIARSAIERIIDRFRADLEYETDYYPHGEIHWNVFDARIDPTSPREAAKRKLLSVADGTAALPGILEESAEAYRRALNEPPGRYLSEDYTFSRYHQMCGGKIWLCLDINLSHTGAATYKGNVSRGIIRVAPKAKAAE